MLRKLAITLILLALFAGLAAMTLEEKRDAAKELVEKGAKFLQENGRKKAFEAFSNKEGEYIYDEFYIFVEDYQGVMVLHPISGKLNGQKVLDVQDPNGVFLFREMIKTTAKEPYHGWVNYMWLQPVSGTVEPKETYVMQVKGTDEDGDYQLILGTGFYK